MSVSETPPLTPLRQARQQAGLMLIELAARAEISNGYLSMIERGYLPPRAVRLRICSALKRREGDLWP